MCLKEFCRYLELHWKLGSLERIFILHHLHLKRISWYLLVKESSEISVRNIIQCSLSDKYLSLQLSILMCLMCSCTEQAFEIDKLFLLSNKKIYIYCYLMLLIASSRSIELLLDAESQMTENVKEIIKTRVTKILFWGNRRFCENPMASDLETGGTDFLDKTRSLNDHQSIRTYTQSIRTWN